MNIADTIIEKPVRFNIGNRQFFIYPSTLGKTYLLARLFDDLDVNGKIMAANPCVEALRLCQEKKDAICRLLSYYTFKKKEEVFDSEKIANRAKLFHNKLSDEELSTLFTLILSEDNTDEYIKYFGIDKERQERKRMAETRDDSGSVTFGGNSIYGTLVDFACQRYGWTMEYVVWGISYANLKMLLADAVTTVYLSAEERKQLRITHDRECIDAGDPKNRNLLRELISE